MTQPAPRSNRMRLGVFLAPFHPLDESPTLCLERDLQLAEFADGLGLDEFWYGEHRVLVNPVWFMLHNNLSPINTILSRLNMTSTPPTVRLKGCLLGYSNCCVSCCPSHLSRCNAGAIFFVWPWSKMLAFW